ncbi:MAG: RagB/SusD family nutrient uptake outer membrane protein [Cyclobacteriaceae bacterium]
MNSIKTYSTLFLIGALLISSSCEDFLDKEPLGDLSTESFYQTQDDAMLATDAIYNAYRAWFVTGGFPIADIMSDDMVKGSSPQDGASLNLIDNFSFTSSEGTFSNIWAALFVGVRRANVVIEEVPDIEMDETLKTRLLGEARFLRAAFYFELARSYGDLPKVLTANPDRQLPRSPVAEIYNEIIIPDLQFAADNLPLKSEYGEEDLGRVTQGAAQGLLSKVYLYREDFTNAQAMAEAVINSGEYALPPNFADEYSASVVQGSGSVFEISALRDNFENGGNQYGQTQGVRGSVQVGGETTGKGWGFGRPTVDIINFYQAGDPRMDASVIFLGDTISGEIVLGDGGTPDTTFTENGQIAQLETYNQKVFMPGTDQFAQWGYNRKILRYADVLLIAAEAANENGNPALALQYLNLVHTRAFSDPAAALTEMEQTALRQLIYNERRAELAFEGERFYDLVRTGQAATVLGPLGFQAGKNELFPVPQSEIDITEGAVSQNPGY